MLFFLSDVLRSYKNKRIHDLVSGFLLIAEKIRVNKRTHNYCCCLKHLYSLVLLSCGNWLFNHAACLPVSPCQYSYWLP